MWNDRRQISTLGGDPLRRVAWEGFDRLNQEKEKTEAKRLGSVALFVSEVG